MPVLLENQHLSRVLSAKVMLGECNYGKLFFETEILEESVCEFLTLHELKALKNQDDFSLKTVPLLHTTLLDEQTFEIPNNQSGKAQSLAVT